MWVCLRQGVCVLCLWHLSVDQPPLHVADFLAPLGRKPSESIPTRAESGTNMRREGKASSSSSASVSVHTFLSEPALVCETLERREDREKGGRQ